MHNKLEQYRLLNYGAYLVADDGHQNEEDAIKSCHFQELAVETVLLKSQTNFFRYLISWKYLIA